MKLPSGKTFLIYSVVILVGLVALIIFVLARRKAVPSPPPSPEVLTEIEQTPQPIIGYPVISPVYLDDSFYFLNEGVLVSYDLQNKADDPIFYPEKDAEFEIISLIPLKNVSAKLIATLEKLSDGSKQIAVFDLKENRITTKFVERLLAVSWLPDQQKLVAYAKSKTDEPFFLLTSLDAKDQQVLAKTSEENVQPLALANNRLIYLVTTSDSKSIKQLDLDSKEIKVVVDKVSKAITSPDGKFVAYQASEGIFVLDTTELIKTSITDVLPMFFNWSTSNLIYGAQANDTVTINRWDKVAKQSTKLLSIKLTDTIPSIEAAFEDALNQQVIYWSDGFLFAGPL